MTVISRFPRALSAASFLFLATGLLLALDLSGCSAFHKKPGDDAACPKARIVPELASLSRFHGDGTNFNDLMYKADVSELSGKCEFTQTSVTIDASFNLVAQRGPQGTDANPDFPYFIAIEGPDGGLVTKSVFPAPLPFKTGQNRSGTRETVSETIAIDAPSSAVNYTVLIGLQLSPEENDYNRTNHVGE